MYLHNKSKDILERLLKSINQESDNLEQFKTNLIEAGKYDLAKKYNSLINEIKVLSEMVKLKIESNSNL